MHLFENFLSSFGNSVLGARAHASLGMQPIHCEHAAVRQYRPKFTGEGCLNPFHLDCPAFILCLLHGMQNLNTFWRQSVQYVSGMGMCTVACLYR